MLEWTETFFLPFQQSCFGIPIDLSSAADENHTEAVPTITTSVASKKPQHHLLASGVLTTLPTPATTLSGGRETDTDTEGLKGSSGSTPNPFTSSSHEVTESISLPAVILSSTAGTASFSGGSGDEDGGGGGGAKRETKRKLLDALEEFAPKRRSSRVSKGFS